MSSLATRSTRRRAAAIAWQPISRLPRAPEGHDYVIWIKGCGARSARWLPESSAWLAGGQVFGKLHASHFVRVNEPDEPGA